MSVFSCFRLHMPCTTERQKSVALGIARALYKCKTEICCSGSYICTVKQKSVALGTNYMAKIVDFELHNCKAEIKS